MRPIRLRRSYEGQDTVPCGQCVECRLKWSRVWAVRMMHEAQLYEDNCWFTATYAPEYLPPYGTLVKSAIPSMLKRLRSRGVKVRYFCAGEYGEDNCRPHYHCALFGYSFPDKVVSGTRDAFPVYRSDELESLWSFGLSEIGNLSFESCSYIARYIMKKVIVTKADVGRAKYVNYDAATGEVVEIAPEFCVMSRNPGIGSAWYDKYKSEVYPEDSVVMRGALQSPPRYYDDKLRVEDENLYVEIKDERKRNVALRSESFRERSARDIIARQRVAGRHL